MATDHPAEPDLDAMAHRLDDLEEGIQLARSAAQEDRILPGKHHPTFIDPDDDQEIDEGDEPTGVITG